VRIIGEALAHHSQVLARAARKSEASMTLLHA